MDSDSTGRRHHRRHTSEPVSSLWGKGYYEKRIGSGSLESFDESDLSFIASLGSSDFHFLSQDDCEPSISNISGVKHQRSQDYDDMLMKTFHNNSSPAKSTAANQHFHSHRRVRSLPSSEFNLLEIFQSTGQSSPSENVSSISVQSQRSHPEESADVLDVLPALGSMSMDPFDIVKVTSEDWNETWKDLHRDDILSPNLKQTPSSTTSSRQSFATMRSFASGSPASSYQTTPQQNIFQKKFSNEFSGDELCVGILSASASDLMPPPQMVILFVSYFSFDHTSSLNHSNTSRIHN